MNELLKKHTELLGGFMGLEATREVKVTFVNLCEAIANEHGLDHMNAAFDGAVALHDSTHLAAEAATG